MTTQQPNRFTQQAWTTAVGKNTRPSTQPQRIDPQVAHDLTKTWARRNAQDLRYALNECKQVKVNDMERYIPATMSQQDPTVPKLGATYSFSPKPGETWADEVERAEAAGWQSGWFPVKKEHKSWAAAARCVVH